MEETIIKILRDIETSKGAVTEKFSNRFLNDVTDGLAKPSCQCCNCSISLVSFQMVTKLRPHQEGLKK